MTLSGVKEWHVRPNPLPKAFGRTLNCGPGAWAMWLWDAPITSYDARGDRIFLYSAPAKPLLRPANQNVC